MVHPVLAVQLLCLVHGTDDNITTTVPSSGATSSQRGVNERGNGRTTGHPGSVDYQLALVNTLSFILAS